MRAWITFMLSTQMPKIGELTVNSVAGTSASGKTKITVSPSLLAGNSYKYKTASKRNCS